MVGLMDTSLGLLLNAAKTRLKTKQIWFKVFAGDPFLRKQILRWIQQDQLFKEGIDEDGDVIGYYSEFTEAINPSKVAGSHFTLFDTGEFYASMYIAVNTNYIEVVADPIKIDDRTGETTNLFNEYGEGIIGLTDENKTKLANALKIRFQREAAKILFNH